MRSPTSPAHVLLLVDNRTQITCIKSIAHSESKSSIRAIVMTDCSFWSPLCYLGEATCPFNVVDASLSAPGVPKPVLLQREALQIGHDYNIKHHTALTKSKRNFLS